MPHTRDPGDSVPGPAPVGCAAQRGPVSAPPPGPSQPLLPARLRPSSRPVSAPLPGPSPPLGGGGKREPGRRRMRRRSGTLDEGWSGFNGWKSGGAAGNRKQRVDSNWLRTQIPFQEQGRRAWEDTPLPRGNGERGRRGKRAGVRAGGRAQPIARRESTARRNIWARGAYRREDALLPAFGSGRMRRRMHCRSDPLDVQ